MASAQHHHKSPPRETSGRRFSGKAYIAFALAVGLLVLGIGWLIASGQFGALGGRDKSGLTLEEIPFNGQRSYEVLQAITAMGPRYSGSEGMSRQRKMLVDHFRKIGGNVSLQEFRVRHPEDGSEVPMANIVVEWHPQRKERVLFCAHYDTRPYPDRDPHPARRKGTFVGANDGASGAALLAELGTHMPEYKGRLGVDFVLFDGEELVYNDTRDTDRYFLGAKQFAQWYASDPPDYRYEQAILLDMVGDASLELYQERNSLRYNRKLVQEVWDVAKDLGVKEFIPRVRHTVRDDHLPLNDIGGIPAIDIIDFDYPYPGAREQYWHTEADIAENCSALSLAKVGWVMLAWLKRQK